MRMLITGGTGLVAGNLGRVAPNRFEVWVTDAVPAPVELPGVQWRVADLTQPDQVRAVFAEARPEVVLHCAAVSNIDLAEQKPDLAWAVNVGGSRTIAECCADHGARLIACSTDTVWDGKRGGYTEADVPEPVNVYGRTKVEMERIISSTVVSWAIARLSMVYGMPAVPGPPAYLQRLLEALAAGKPTSHSDTELRTPVDVLTVRDALLELAEWDYVGFIHLPGTERATRRELALRVAEYVDADPDLIRSQTPEDEAAKAPRPRDATMSGALAAQCLSTPLRSISEGLVRVLPPVLGG